MICYTAIFGDSDELKEPVVTPGWKYICFTDQDFKSDVWEIVKMPGDRKKAREIKILFHKFLPDHEKSIWVDGSFKVNCDLNEWFKNVTPPITVVKHPVRKCIYHEANKILEYGRSGAERLGEQMEYYREIVRIPVNKGLIQSGLLMRYNDERVKALCERWWQEVDKWSLRDQIAFTAVSLKVDFVNVIRYDYRSGKQFIYTKHKE